MSKKIKYWHKFYSLGEEDFFDLRRFSNGKRNTEIKRRSRYEAKRNLKSKDSTGPGENFLTSAPIRDYGATYREEMLYFLQNK